MTHLGIETATFGLVAQCFNLLRRRVPPSPITHYAIRHFSC